MAAMQQVKTPVGETDAQPVTSPFREPFIQHRPIEYDLILGRERGGRQDAVTQFGQRHRRRAAFAARMAESKGAFIASRIAMTAATVSPAPETSRTFTG